MHMPALFLNPLYICLPIYQHIYISMPPFIYLCMSSYLSAQTIYLRMLKLFVLNLDHAQGQLLTDGR